MADKNVLFRNAVGGFNKADVTAYIDKQNADFLELQNQKNEAVAAKDAEIEDLKNQLKEMTERAEKAEAKIDELSLPSGAEEELRKKLDEAEEALFEKDALIEKLQSGTANVSSESERKAGLYDDMSSQLGDILITANKNADMIIAQATEKAAEISEKAVIDAEERKRAFAARMTRISAAVKNNTAAAAENFRGDIKSELEQLRQTLKDTVGAVDEKSAVLTELADKLENRLNAELDCAVTEIDKETETLKIN